MLEITLTLFLKKIIYFMCLGVFACMCVCVKMLEILELQLQTVVSCHVCARN